MLIPQFGMGANMRGEVTASPLPDGYAGGLMVDLEAERRQEAAVADFILARARSLAWQAVRHTPCDLVCAEFCLAWIRRAGVWAGRRDMQDLAGELTAILERLEGSLPKLATTKYQ